MPTDTATPEPTNGTPPNGAQKPPQEQSLLESQERARRLVESAMWAQMYDGFGGGSDAMFDLFQERYGNPGSGYWLPVSVVSDRKRGDNYPIWRNEHELGQYRQRSRIISRKNSYARSLLFNLLTHNIGKGFTYEIQPKKDRDAAPEQPGVQPNPQDDQIVKRTQQFVDKFLMTNRFTASVNPDPDASVVSSSREWESGRRVWRDGETIFRLFFVEDNESDLRGMTFVRFVEPEQVTDPPQAGDGTGWSYGMRHQTEPFEDEEDIKEYYVKYKGTRNDGQDGEYVPASEIVHLKNLEEDAATKRGLPAFSLDMVDSLERASKLMRNVSTSSGVRAATAEIWQHEGASEAQVQSLATRLAERQFVNPVSGRTETQERTRPGSTRRIPMGQKPVWPQAVGASEHLEVLQGDLRQCGAVFAAPEYMTGDASNANYSSSKEAGAPFVIASEVTQGHFKTAFMIVVLRAIKWGVKCGLLPENTLDVVELQVTAPTISVRDPLQTAQEDQILIGAKIKSVKTAQGERGLDPDHEAANNEEFDAKFGQQGGPLPMPGDGGDPFGMGGGGGQPAPTPQLPGGGGLESLDALESFTGIDKNGHKWVAGKQVAAPASPDKHVETWASYASKIPAKVMQAAKVKVKGHYDRLESRYGRPTALAIVGAGIAAFPLPGGTIIGPAPIVAVAELLRWLRSKKEPAMESEEETLTPEEIQRLGKEFMAAVMGEEDATDVQESFVESLIGDGATAYDLLEAGFTGVLTDRLGHKQHYQDGKHVAGPTAIDHSHASHPKAPELAQQAVKLWGANAKAKLEEAIANHADDVDPAAQRKVMAAKVALAGLSHSHDIGDFDLGKEFGEPAKEEPKPLPAAPNAAPAPENVVKAKPLGKVEDAATLDAAHETVKNLFDSALTDAKLSEKVDAAMASIDKELTVAQLKQLAGRFGINDVSGKKGDLVARIGVKIKSRREQHERTKR